MTVSACVSAATGCGCNCASKLPLKLISNAATRPSTIPLIVFIFVSFCYVCRNHLFNWFATFLTGSRLECKRKNHPFSGVEKGFEVWFRLRLCRHHQIIG